MGVPKLFECLIFRPEFDCPYTVSGDEGQVIEDAAGHELREHNIEDTPETRQEIKESLLDSGNTKD